MDSSKEAEEGAGPLTSTPVSHEQHHICTRRMHEKAKLQKLNDRLVTYIGRMRSQEQETCELTMHICEENIARDVASIKEMYDIELSEAHKILNESVNERAKLEIQLGRLSEENANLKTRLDKKTKDFVVADNNARMFESRFTDINAKYNTAISERKKFQDEAKELDKECEKLRKQLDALRKNLEEETLTRVDLENTLQSLREELSFKDGIHQQELQETRSRRQVELSEIDGRLTEKYEEKLRESLQELREQYEGQMRQNRDEVDMLYDAKIKNLQNALNANSNQAASAYEELRITKATIDGLKSRINELEGNNASLQSRVRDLESLLEIERNRHGDIVRSLEAELMRLREEMALQLQEYQDLMDIKVSLDMEIAAYDKLLAGEEHRLNISASQTTASTSFRSASRTGRRTPSRSGVTVGAKRKRTLLEESEERNFSDFSITASAKGDIEIVECDPEGKFVKVHNKGGKEVQIGGWQLVRTAGGNETSFKFHRSVKADGGATITVWSTDISGVTHDPPSTIVMNGKKWFVGDNMKTVLLNGDGEEVAMSERVRQQLSSLSQRHRELGGGGEDYYHHSQLRSASRASSYGSGDARGTEKCRVM